MLDTLAVNQTCNSLTAVVYNTATIVAEIYRTYVFCDKFLLSRGRRRSFLTSKWQTKLLLTGSHEVVSRKVRNRLKRKNISLESFFSKRRTAKIFVFTFLELFRFVNPGANFCTFNLVSENAVRTKSS